MFFRKNINVGRKNGHKLARVSEGIAERIACSKMQNGPGPPRNLFPTLFRTPHLPLLLRLGIVIFNICRRSNTSNVSRSGWKQDAVPFRGTDWCLFAVIPRFRQSAYRLRKEQLKRYGSLSGALRSPKRGPCTRKKESQRGQP